MLISGIPHRTIRINADRTVTVIDQTKLPHAFELVTLKTAEDAANAIRHMLVRGAPLIGVTAACGLALALASDPSDESIHSNVALLRATRPTAVNLIYALEIVSRAAFAVQREARADVAFREAERLLAEDVEGCRRIGEHGLPLLRALAEKKGPNGAVQVLTHCNAGWLACVDYGTALAPIYLAHEEGIRLHVFVDETRPRNQGASLTAYELSAHGIPCTLLADNAGGHLMQRGEIDLVVVGSDRTTRTGDVANKIGTYLKALAAKDCGVPFWVALPSSTLDWSLQDGREIPIEERSDAEVLTIAGRAADGVVTTVSLAPKGVSARNPGFDVTPARLVTGLITERGRTEASEAGLLRLYPERAR